MMTKKTIDDTAIKAATDLEEEYFYIVKEDGGQHRVLKNDKTIEDFNDAHAIIWGEHEAALISGGYLTIPVPVVTRDLPAEIDALKSRLDKIETPEAR